MTSSSSICSAATVDGELQHQQPEQERGWPQSAAASAEGANNAMVP